LKGLVFNLLEQVVVRNHGEAAWDDLLDATGIPGAYTSLGSYPDEEIGRLVDAGAKALGLEPAEVLRWFGREAMPLLAQRYPAFFDGHSSTRSFVLSVNRIIHPEVHKLYAGARCPIFGFEEQGNGDLSLSYDSSRRLCALAQGFIEGAADHFRERAHVEHVACMHHRDPTCVLRLRVLEADHADAAD
jgi:hypothetical protein